MAASPTPAATESRPQPGLLIYDGDCGFCTRSANWLAKRAGAGAPIAPWQQTDLAAHGLTPELVASAAWWSSEVELVSGADAIAAALRAAPLPWRALGQALQAPGVIHLARVLYSVIARNRHRLPGSTATCQLNSEDPH